MNCNHNLNSTINLSAALVCWYKFEKASKILLLTPPDSVFEEIANSLRAKDLQVNTKIDDQKYDYVIVISAIETSENPVVFLKKIRACLNTDGRLFIGVYNRFALRHFLGDKDPFSGHVLDGIDGYRNVSPSRLAQIGGHCYSKSEIEKMLIAAGFDKYQPYSVMPALERPQVILKYGYQSNEALDLRVFPQYISPKTVYMSEEQLYDSLFENDMFHQMANGYLFECIVDGELTDYDQITVQGDRAPEEAMATIIKKGKLVEKRALYPQGESKLRNIYNKNEELKSYGVPVVDVDIVNDRLIMPFVEGEIATSYLRSCMRMGRECFLNEINTLRAIIEQSSDYVPYEEIDWLKFEPDWEKRKEDDPNLHKWEQLSQGSNEDKAEIGVILKHGYIDMVSINCFHNEDGYQFFDQEFYVENFPANSILIRTIDFVYNDCPEMHRIYPIDELLKELKLLAHADTWRKNANVFLESLRNEKELAEYHRKCRRDYITVQSNRHRMDYPQDEYERLFCNIFKDIQNKKIVLFGSGRYSEQFIERFGQYLDIVAVVDNNSAKWGKEFHGIKVISPEKLKEIEHPFKVFICIKLFEEVLNQIKDMKIKDVSIYDPRLDYERPAISTNVMKAKVDEPVKPYHVGYVAGVFDVFHVGHINLLRRAKEQCDYLIVGIVSDEQVISNKKTKPYMSFEERRQIVEACKYVDEVVKIPAERPDTEDAWRMYHFDAQFSGSDYENDPYWLAKREFLRQHGSDLVFFPYTESVSSTILKSEIRRG